MDIVAISLSWQWRIAAEEIGISKQDKSRPRFVTVAPQFFSSSPGRQKSTDRVTNRSAVLS